MPSPWRVATNGAGPDGGAFSTALTWIGGQALALLIPGFVLVSMLISPEPSFVYVSCGIGWMAVLVGMMWLRGGRVRLASNLVVVGLLSVVVALTVHGGAASHHAGAFAPAIIGAAGLVGSLWTTLWVTLGSISVVIAVYVSQRLGLHPVALPTTFDVVAPVAQLLAAGGFSGGLIHAYSRALARLQEREAELQRSEERYTALFEQAPDGMLLLSAEGRVLAANHAGRRMLAPLTLGMRFLDLPIGAAHLALARDLAQGTAVAGELALARGPDPTVIAVNTTRLDQPAGGVQLMVRDVTQEKRAEEAQRALEQRLRRSERMEVFGELAGGVSHDFNNILTGILGHLDLARGEAEDLGVDGTRFHRRLLAVEQAAQRGAALTRKLLQFSRLRDVDAGNTDLAQAVWESEKLMKPLIREDIQLEVSLEETGFVGISTSAVGQIVMNLVINACDAMTRGGTVRVHTGQREICQADVADSGEPPPGRYAVLEVRDTGPGISAAVLPRIFEPFFTTKAAGVGTGLGLSTVHGIVRRAHGHVRVVSTPGEGALFCVYLPLVTSVVEPQPVAPAARREPLGQARFVLVCEDEGTIRDVITEVLLQQGFRVRATGSPREALAWGKELGAELSLLISDVIMPEMNGAQLVSQLKESLPDLKVLHISGYTAGLLKDLGIGDDDRRLLSKPFTPSLLLERVFALLGPA